MNPSAQAIESEANHGMTDEEIARQLSLEEGATVTVIEVRRLLCQGMRKLRSALLRRGLQCDDLFGDEGMPRW